MEAGSASDRATQGQPQTGTLARERSRVGASTFAACMKDKSYFESCLYGQVDLLAPESRPPWWAWSWTPAAHNYPLRVLHAACQTMAQYYGA